MASKDIARTLKPVQSIAPGLINATATGAAVDTLGYEGVVCVVDAGTRTDGTHTPKLQDTVEDPASPGNPLASGWADVAAADLNGSFAAVASNVLQWVGYRGGKRFVRGVSTVVAGATGAVYGAVILLGEPQKAPTA
jgi:hypothetical protein